jgi:alcohol dehydrogenase class IV
MGEVPWLSQPYRNWPPWRPRARIPLARMAVEETGMGVLEDKVIKNHFASEYIYNAYKDERTCGTLAVDDLFGTMTIAEPVGLICGIVPTTNPTSTAIFKALISLKTRNGIIFSPHPRARRSTCATARILKGLGLEVEIFHEVEADPTLAVVRKGVAMFAAFRPDVIVALGGGSPMDAAKIMGVLYEHPEIQFEDLALRFMDIRKRIYKFPKMGVKSLLVAIPTTSGTGSEVTPFAVVTDEATGVNYPIADYELTPTMAIVDPDLVLDLPRSLTAFGGIDAVTHGLEAYVSVMANEYSDPQALQALRLLKEHLPAAYLEGCRNPKARELVHNAATIAGIAFANAFLGVCHSMAHKLGAEFHLAHGLANALLICNMIRYNATDTPTKQTAFSQYDRPQARHRYGEIALHLGLSGRNTAERIDSLVAWNRPSPNGGANCMVLIRAGPAWSMPAGAWTTVAGRWRPCCGTRWRPGANCPASGSSSSRRTVRCT